MKSPILMLLCFGGSTAQTLDAATYAIEKFTVAAGGGFSFGGRFSVSGTAGQPNSSNSVQNGHYVLSGGFWTTPDSFQEVEPPVLSVAQSAQGSIIISWPSRSDGWVLQHTSSLATQGWSVANQPVLDDGVRKSMTIPAPTGTRFFRLAK